MLQVHHLLEKVGLEQCQGSRIEALLQGVPEQDCPSRDSENLLGHVQNCAH